MNETKKQIKEREKNDACEQLRALFPAGSTVYCIVRSVARSGMSREISFFASIDGRIQDIDWLICRALEMHLGKSGIKVQGCGMDMGFHVVYNLASVLYRAGFQCTGKNGFGDDRCPSNDHSNGDRDYTPHMHSSGGYALRHRWL